MPGYNRGNSASRRHAIAATIKISATFEKSYAIEEEICLQVGALV